MTDSFVLVAGASRGVGREIVNYLVNDNRRVKALFRSHENQSELEALGIEVSLIDTLNFDNLKNTIMADNYQISAIISTVGGLPKDGERSDFLGNKNLIDLAVLKGIQHFILISSIGSGNSSLALPLQVLEVLGPVLKEKEMAERHLSQSGLNYTIIRPGGLKSEPKTQRGILTENNLISGTINRADVAELTYQCLFNVAAYGKTFSAVDRDMMNPILDNREFFNFK
jgi:nucleoside-diphosphate-sugar epimerase